jgi:Sigma-54 factor, Activator interacting domain (AID)
VIFPQQSKLAIVKRRAIRREASMTKKPKAPEVKLGHDLGLRQQLVMTPQLEQAVNILKLSLPELEAMVQNELAPRGNQKKGH